MAGYVFPQLFGGQQAQPAPQAQPQPATARDYWQQAIQQEVQRQQAIDAQPPRFTPEQLQARKDANEREYQMGLLSMLSDNEALQGAGGAIFKNALAMRTPKITEKGSVDQITGEYTYDPDYLRQQSQTRLSVLQQAMAQAQQRDEEKARHEETLRALGADRAAAAAARAGAGEGAVTGTSVFADPEGKIPLFKVKGQPGLSKFDDSGQTVPHAGPVYSKPANSQPSEGERKAASLLQRLQFSQAQLAQAIKDDPTAEVGTGLSQVLSHVPVAGDYLVTKTQSPARQRVENAQLDILDAALTLGTGAAYTREQLKGYAKSYFAQPGETDPQVLKDKRDRLQNVIKSAELAAGRAATGRAAGGGGGEVSFNQLPQ